MKLCSIKDNKTGKWFEWINDTFYQLGDKTPIFDLDKAQDIYKFLKTKYKYNISFFVGDEEVLHLNLPKPKPIPAYMFDAPIPVEELRIIRAEQKSHQASDENNDMFNLLLF